MSSRRGRERKQRLAPFKAKAPAGATQQSAGLRGDLDTRPMDWSLPRPLLPPDPRDQLFHLVTWVFAVPLGSLLKRGY